MSLANKISLCRIFLVPAVVASLVYYHPSRDVLRYVTLVLFLIGMASDAVDGFIARSKEQASQLGALLDAIADKLLILSTLISLSAIQGLPEWMRVPAWFNLIVISRDAIIVSGTVILFTLTGHWVVRPSRLGKWTTGVQMLVVPTVLLRLPVKDPLIVLAALLTIVSGAGYVRQGSRALNHHSMRA